MPEQTQGRRYCPACGADSVIQSGQALWPAGWVCDGCGRALAYAHDFPLLAPQFDEMDEGFDLENFPRLAQVESQHFWFQSRNELIRWLIEQHAPRARRTLEIGCGTGFALKALREALPTGTIAGSELHSQGLLTARMRHGEAVELFQMDARKSYLADALDLVGAFDVLEHIPEDQDVLSEIARILKPGGTLVATVPQHMWMWSTADDVAFHQRRYRHGELAQKALKAGLQPIYTSSFVTLAFPLMIASRVIQKLRPKKLSPIELCAQEYQIPTTGNSILLSLCRLEHLLRRAGVPLPFGGSQVLVARRPISSQNDPIAAT